MSATRCLVNVGILHSGAALSQATVSNPWDTGGIDLGQLASFQHCVRLISVPHGHCTGASSFSDESGR